MGLTVAPHAAAERPGPHLNGCSCWGGRQDGGRAANLGRRERVRLSPSLPAVALSSRGRQPGQARGRACRMGRSRSRLQQKRQSQVKTNFGRVETYTSSHTQACRWCLASRTPTTLVSPLWKCMEGESRTIISCILFFTPMRLTTWMYFIPLRI